MARLPVTSQDALRGAQISSATVDGGTMGLDRLGAAISQFDENEEARARKRAQEALSQAEAEFGTAAARREAEWDRTSPGLSKAVTDDFDLVSTKYRTTLGDREQRHFDELASASRMQAQGRAGAVEAQALGALVRGQEEAKRNASVMRKVSEAGTRWTERRVADVTGASGQDVTAPDYRSRLLAEFDAETKAAIDAAPEYERAALTTSFERLRIDIEGDVTREQISQGEAKVKADVTATLSVLENRVIADPNSYPTVLAEGVKAIGALPPQVRATVAQKWPGQLLDRIASRYTETGDVYGLDRFLSDPKFQASARMDPDQFARYRGWVDTAKSDQAMAARRGALDDDLANIEAEARTALETGASLGDLMGRLPGQQAFVAAYGFEQGPARYQAARQGVIDLKAAADVARSARTMSPGDYARYTEGLKPRAGDPDFARKDKIWRTSLEMGQRLQEARMKDPAAVVATDPMAQGAYQKFLGGEPGAARQWASLAVRQQQGWGLGRDEIRVLPEAIASREVEAIKGAPPEALGERLTGLAARLSAYGPNGAYALRDLQRAGLDAPTAALVQYAGVNPRVMSEWAQTQMVDSFKMSKLDKDVRVSLEKKVLNTFAPFEKTFGSVLDHKLFAAQIRDVALKMATARMANGESKDEAVRAVRKLLIDDKYVIDDKAGWRLPREVAGRAFSSDDLFGRVDEGSFSDRMRNTLTRRGGTVVAKDLIRDGANYELKRILDGTGPVRLRAAGTDTRLSEDQRRQREAAYIRERGRWVSTADDQGLILMAPDATNTMTVVLDAEGKPITRTYDQLLKTGLDAYKAGAS